MKPISQIAFAVAPALALFLYLILLFRNGRKFGMVLIKSFLAGIISVIIMVAAVYLAPGMGIVLFTDLTQTLIYSFIIVGFSSELGKFILLKFYILPKDEVDSPIHAVAVSIMIALGHATAATLLFVFKLYVIQPPYPFNMYLFLAGPSHICFGIVMGFFVGMSKFTDAKVRSLLTGLAAASFFNGLFMFALISNNFKLMSLYAFGSALVMMVLVVKAMFTKIE